jgi:hypothetical protein
MGHHYVKSRDSAGLQPNFLQQRYIHVKPGPLGAMQLILFARQRLLITYSTQGVHAAAFAVRLLLVEADRLSGMRIITGCGPWYDQRSRNLLL